MSSLAELLEHRRILVVAGTGGVGKTTIGAALAVEAARRGRRVLVLTIDPARRLYDALGLGEPARAASGAAQRLGDAACKDLGIEAPGSLDALMLDMKSTFDGLVDRFAEGQQTKQRILENPIYQHVSDALAGSAEYAAMEKVFELAESDHHDLIVVDTPPSQHALDFLEAPNRLVEFLDSRLVQLLVHPAMAAGRFGFRIFHRTSQRVLQVIERISGVSFLEDISEFLLAIDGMSEGFRERATKVRARLVSNESAFLLVAGPSPEAARTGFEFLARMRETGVPVEGVLMNRIRKWPESTGVPRELSHGSVKPEDLQKLADALAPLSGERATAAARAATLAATRYASLVELDERSAAPLREQAERNGQIYARIPELPSDVCDPKGLGRIAQALFGRNGAADHAD